MVLAKKLSDAGLIFTLPNGCGEGPDISFSHLGCPKDANLYQIGSRDFEFFWDRKICTTMCDPKYKCPVLFKCYPHSLGETAELSELSGVRKNN